MTLLADLLSSKETVLSNLLHVFSALIVATGEVGPTWPESALIQDGATFDYVIVGAGSAGSVVASRLSEDPEIRVLLLEAGGDPPITSVIPGGLLLLPNTPADWGFYSINDKVTAQAQAKPGSVAQIMGKMLGGSSSINYMFYNRGDPSDYDEWSQIGKGWSWDSVFPYFLKSEGMEEQFIFEDEELKPYHNREGPIKVSQAKNTQRFDEKLDIYMDAFEEIGIKKIKDYNGPDRFGISRSFFTHSKPPAKRYSTAQAFLTKAIKNNNLLIVKHALVEKIIFDDNKRAIGVQSIVKDETLKLYASKEVILSAGVFNSPKILINSGVGPKEDLKKLNVDVISDLPVGHGLMDHLTIPIFFTGRKNSLLSTVANSVPPINLDSLPLASLTGYYSVQDMNKREYQLVASYFQPGSILTLVSCLAVVRYNLEICLNAFKNQLNTEIFLAYIINLHPKSRGRVRVSNTDPFEPPEIEMGLLTDKEDYEIFKRGINRIMNMTDTTYFKDASSEFFDLKFPECENLKFRSDEFWDCYIKTGISNLNHPAGTCAMGKVVDESMKVLGVEALRVIDASVFPTLPSGNINAPVIMVGEKVADIIKEYYRNASTFRVDEDTVSLVH